MKYAKTRNPAKIPVSFWYRFDGETQRISLSRGSPSTCSHTTTPTRVGAMRLKPSLSPGSIAASGLNPSPV